MVYPSIMAALGFFIMVFLVTFILPRITPIFDQFDVELPLPTKIILWLSDNLTGNGPLLLISCGVIALGVMRFLSTKTGQLYRDRLMLSLPVIGDLTQKLILYRFTISLESLMQGGVGLKQALDILKKILDNQVYQAPFAIMSSEITQMGLNLSQALKRTGLFSPSVIQMIRVGEETGKMVEMLSQISKQAETDMDEKIERLVALLEPVMILAMAFVVGFIVVSIMLPMFKMNQLI